MATETITKLLDDLTGGAADETVKFGLDGREYEIDLNARNAKKLREALAPFVDAGTKASAGRGRKSKPLQNTAERERNRAIRAWAHRAGKEISDRGRIPEGVIREYDAAQRQPAEEKPAKAAKVTKAPTKRAAKKAAATAPAPEFSEA